MAAAAGLLYHLRAMKKTTYPTAQDAEAAFYEALEAADVDAMMEIWSDDEDIVCIHPGGPRFSGFADVRASWAEIFSGGRRLDVQVSNQVVLGGMMLAVHSVRENISVKGASRSAVPVAATNAYLRTSNGWRMILHHASPAPQGATQQRTVEAETPKVLH